MYRKYKNKAKLPFLSPSLLLIIILALSSYTHLWNPVGFPDIFFDEGVYMRRAMNMLDTGSPQEAYLYDHPYFGQIILASIFQLVNYPDSLDPLVNLSSLESLYMIPRIFMGLLAVLDTFLIYKITEKKFGRKVAVIASILFAVMPMSWLFRRILLDSILVPFILSSILFAIHSQNSSNKSILVILSGICLGLAIFTKIPAFTMIPLIVLLVYHSSKNGNGKRNVVKYIGLWFIPVVLIPAIWPAYGLSIDQFDLWVDGILWQSGRTGDQLPYMILYLFSIDSVLLILGIAGFIFAITRREKFLVLWFAPLILFFTTIGYIQYFHWIPLIPVMCIASAVFIKKYIDRIEKITVQNYTFLLIIILIGGFGLATTSMIISSDMSSSQFAALLFVLQNTDKEDDVTILAGPVYSWVLHDVYGRENVPADYSIVFFEPVKTEKILLVADPHFMYDISRGQELVDIYENTKIVERFHGMSVDEGVWKFPYGTYLFTQEGKLIEIKRNW